MFWNFLLSIQLFCLSIFNLLNHFSILLSKMKAIWNYSGLLGIPSLELLLFVSVIILYIWVPLNMAIKFYLLIVQIAISHHLIMVVKAASILFRSFSFGVNSNEIDPSNLSGLLPRSSIRLIMLLLRPLPPFLVNSRLRPWLELIGLHVLLLHILICLIHNEN